MNEKDRYMDPMTEFGIQRLFGTEANNDLALDFVNSLLRGKDEVREMHHLPTERIFGVSVYDTWCVNAQGDRVIVQIQQAYPHPAFKDRTMYYAAKGISERWFNQDDNFINGIYLIHLLDFEMEDYTTDSFIHEVGLMDMNSKRMLNNSLVYYFVEVPKCRKEADALESKADKWVYALRNLPTLEARPEALHEPIFARLFDVADRQRFTPAERTAYEASLWKKKNQ